MPFPAPIAARAPAPDSRPQLGQGPGDVFLAIDIQDEFVSGAFAVPGSRSVVSRVNQYALDFAARGLPVLYTRDVQPSDHGASGTRGGAFAPGLAVLRGTRVVSNADHPGREAGSAFADSDLGTQLRELNAKRLFVCGLAGDERMLATVKDALAQGYAVVVLADAIRPEPVSAPRTAHG